MSDFLTRLAERTLGQANSIRPRLPEWFGPNLSAQDQIEKGLMLVAHPSTQDLGTTGEVETVPPGHQDDAVFHPRLSTTKNDIVVKQVTGPHAESKNGEERNTTVKTVTIAGSKKTIAHHSTIEKRSIIPEEATVTRPMVLKTSASLSSARLQPPGMKGDIPVAQAPAASSQIFRQYVPIVKNGFDNQKIEGVHVPVHLPASKTEKVAPEIKVTIGRVEVRATVTQAPVVKKKAAPAAGMSLDAYLKGRSGGSR